MYENVNKKYRNIKRYIFKTFRLRPSSAELRFEMNIAILKYKYKMRNFMSVYDDGFGCYIQFLILRSFLPCIITYV